MGHGLQTSNEIVFLSLKTVSLIPQNSSDPDEVVHFVTSRQDLQSLSIYLFAVFQSRKG